VASILARFWQSNTPHAVTTTTLFAAVAWMPLLKTLALAFSGPLLARRLRIRAGALLIPLVGGVMLVHYGWMTIELPPWLLMTAYAIIGWRIGLRFTRPLLAHAIRTLPQVAGCTLVLIAICMALAALLVVVGRVDPLTAYLAMSPGGADTVAIIATSSNVDLSFVMSMQMLRLVGVLTLGPALAQFLARRVTASPESKMSETPASEVVR
jgi:membrane AbrB-like protein